MLVDKGMLFEQGVKCDGSSRRVEPFPKRTQRLEKDGLRFREDFQTGRSSEPAPEWSRFEAFHGSRQYETSLELFQDTWNISPELVIS